MLDSDGRILRYIIREGGPNGPRSVCMIADCKIIVGEEKTGLAKTVKLLGKKTLETLG